MTVWVTQNPIRRNRNGDIENKLDLDPARKYGDLVVLLPNGPHHTAPLGMARALRDKLKDFTQGDYLLCLGDPMAIAAAAAVVADLNMGVIPLLIWDRKKFDYVAVRVDTSEDIMEDDPYDD